MIAKSQIVGPLVDNNDTMEDAAFGFLWQGNQMVKQEEISLGVVVAYGIDVAQVTNMTGLIAHASVIFLYRGTRQKCCSLFKFGIWSNYLAFALYVEWVEMRSSRVAIVSQAAKLVNVKAVKTGSQAKDSPANDDGSTYRRLREVNLTANAGIFGSAFDIDYSWYWPLLFKP